MGFHTIAHINSVASSISFVNVSAEHPFVENFIHPQNKMIPTTKNDSLIQKKYSPTFLSQFFPKILTPFRFTLIFFGGIKPRKAPNSFQDPWGSETWRLGDGFTCNSECPQGRNPKVSHQKLFETLDWLENPP